MVNKEIEIAESIRRCLDMASNQFSSTGILAKWTYQSDDPAFAVYILRYSSFSSSKARDVIVVPVVHVSNIRHGAIEDLITALSEDAKLRRGNRRIMFIDCFDKGSSPLGKEVSVLTPGELWHFLTAIPDYYENVICRDTEILQIDATFVDRSILGFQANSQNSEPALDYVQRWVKNYQDAGRRGLAIVGERGAGKTWLLKHFQKIQMSQHQKSPWQHPAVVFVSMRDYAVYLKREQGIKRTMSHYICEKYHLRSIAGVMLIESLISAGAIILALDALDELSREVSPRELEVLIDDLLDCLAPSARVIITSRETKFLSRGQIIEKLASPRIDIVANETNHINDTSLEYVKHSEERSHRPIFDIIHLKSFNASDTRILDQRIQKAKAIRFPDSEQKDQSSIDSWLALIPANDKDRDFLTKSIMSLCEIPACSKQLADSRRINPAHLLYLYETVLIGPLIAFNLRAGRAVEEALLREDTEKEILSEKILLNLHTRLRIVELVGRFLLEQSRFTFDMEMLSGVLSEMLGDPFDAIMTDLRSQSVFEFADETTGFDLKFRSDDMLGYFTARHIARLLGSVKNCREGLQLLGRYSFERNFQKFILPFLACFIESGFVELPKDLKRSVFKNAENQPRFEIDISIAKKEAIRLVKEGEAYSVWTRFINTNLEKIGIENIELKESNAWDRSPLKLINNEEIVIIAENDRVKPFAILPHEVTNSEFYQFIKSDIAPILPEEPDEYQKHQITFGKKSQELENHPLGWHRIHLQESSPCGDRQISKYLAFTNAYHLFTWTENGVYPMNIRHHPVVWPSMYVCALYCNWKTHMEMGPQHYFYDIGLRWQNNQKRLVPYLNCKTKKDGYRLPTEKEWSYAARGGDKGRNPWDLLMRSPEDSDEYKRGQRMKRSLTRQTTKTHDVRKARANGYGIFGMLGNVREWAHLNNLQETEFGSIMGGTWALGDQSFEYEDKGAGLPAGNTNLDAGFRIVRSLFSQENLIREARKNIIRQNDVKGGTQ